MSAEMLRSLAHRRILFVAAHPDDEVIGAGAMLARLKEPIFAYLTDGAPADLRDASAKGFASREQYANARRAERDAALALAGHPRPHVVEFGRIDQEASFELAALARELTQVAAAVRPELIMTHPYEGGHPDHDAAAFAVHAARALAARAARAAPAIAEFTSYHERAGRMETGEFLHRGAPVFTAELTSEQREMKRRMLQCHASQREVLAAFGLASERFRAAPAYDFTRPAAAAIYYERQPWNMDVERWCALARDAMRELELEGPL